MFSRIILRPGVNTDITQTSNQAGISDSNLIRFYQGLPEKVGGWVSYVSAAMGSVTRSLLAWQDQLAAKWLSAGNLSSLKVIAGGVVSDITPQIKTTSPVLNLSTSQGSKVVTIVDTAINNLWQYDVVNFNTPISIGGLVLTGQYPVRTGAAGTTYTILASTEATSTVANAGAVPSFTTLAGDSAVVVTLAAHGLVDNDSVTFPIATIVGGITVFGAYRAASVTATNTFTILSPVLPSSNDTKSMNGGLAQFKYYLTDGPSQSTASGGLGAVGELAVGEGRVVTSTVTRQTGTPITAEDWTQANWGEQLIACPRGGPVFYWPPNTGFRQAVPVGTAPPANNGILIAMPQRQLVAWGTAASMIVPWRRQEFDPLMIRWSDVDNYFDWKASSLNQAGSYRLPTGSVIRGAMQGSNQSFIFTDIDVWSMQYLGPPLVYGFTPIGSGCGLLGPHAVCSLHGVIYFMGPTNFFRVGSNSSNVQPIPSTIWDEVYSDLDQGNAQKVVAGANSMHDEIWFFYPSLTDNTGENSRYVKYCVSEGVWDKGILPRSAWSDVSIITNPIGADPVTQLIQQHETGMDADGVAINSWYETGYFAIGEGEEFATVDHFEPDMKWTSPTGGSSSATLQVTLSTQTYPNSGVHMSNTLTMTSTTPYLTPRVRGRQLKWRIESNDLGSFWRQGLIRYRLNAPDGRR